MPRTSGVYHRNARVGQYTKLNVISHIDRMMWTKHTIISIDAGKAFAKFLQTFIITLRTLGTEGNFYNMIKAI